MSNRFSRLERLIGHDNLDVISRKCVLVIGLGGVGGYVVESLVRSGIGKIIIVDHDSVDESNINRQIIALSSTVGCYKVDEFEKRINDINPKCEVVKIKEFIDSYNIDDIFMNDIDFVVDACDTVSTKKSIVSECIKRNIDFISCMGTGNKLDPSKLEITDIRNTMYDPLARIMRKYVRDMKINKRVMVLSSKEIPKKVDGRTPASSAFVPSSAGLLISSYIIRYFIGEIKSNY